MVAGLLQPDAGTISVFGIDARRDPIAAKQIIAWVSDEPMVYDRLTPLEYLEFVAGLWQIDAGTAERQSHELIDWLGLSPHANERCGGFSKGMLQKVALAGALVHDPRLIILDEPLTGLDAGSARQVKDVLLQKVRAGRHRHHDHPHPRSRRTHGRAHRRHRPRPADRRRHARRTAHPHRPRQTSLEEIFLDLVAQGDASAAA